MAGLRKIRHTGPMDELAALRLQIEWGADEALLDAPVDRTRGAPARLAGAAAAAPAPAAASAAGAGGLAELQAALAAFDGCALKATATNLVFADGDPRAALLIVVDAPGSDDDRAGRLLAGADGAYLDRMLASIGLNRSEVLVSALVPWRPPGGRPPSAAEIAQCLPFLHRLIALTRPRMIALAGPLAARTLTGGVRPKAAAWVRATAPGAEAPIPSVVFSAPAMLLRTPAKRAEAWTALRLLKRALDRSLTQS